MTRLLVVDDDEGVREVIAERLLLEGYETVTATGGHEALSLVAADPQAYAAVVSDVRMPRGSGIDLLEGMNRLPHRPPLLFFSAYTDYSHREISALGGAGFFQKPFDLEKVVAAIAAILADQP